MGNCAIRTAIFLDPEVSTTGTIARETAQFHGKKMAGKPPATIIIRWLKAFNRC